MKLRPCQAPDCRVTGARPARLKRIALVRSTRAWYSCGTGGSYGRVLDGSTTPGAARCGRGVTVGRTRREVLRQSRVGRSAEAASTPARTWRARAPRYPAPVSETVVCDSTGAGAVRTHLSGLQDAEPPAPFAEGRPSQRRAAQAWDIQVLFVVQGYADAAVGIKMREKKTSRRTQRVSQDCGCSPLE